MFDFLDKIPAEWRPFAAFVFIIFFCGGLAWQYLRGRREGNDKPSTQVKEFAMSGQFLDMGPVKELIGQTGLLVQQQVKTNMHLEAHTKKQGQTAVALFTLAKHIGRLADAYEAQIERQKRDDEVDRLVEQRLEEERERTKDEEPRRRPTRT